MKLHKIFFSEKRIYVCLPLIYFTLSVLEALNWSIRDLSEVALPYG